ncbi:phosphonate transport system substrate-binding protein [Sinobacterium caligoides]|uniref:Phosphonate transport system substrate-binding protein n=1 Tax=Sinobacterium caligoides TaxID=933926 RepID=A0A3N2DS49_9GAMM|nr:phosphonate ABC transporter substrate-binding protein [Sinobacterium caligoides]ROS02065.1 phosphonate transport system substrate-binding protein [Sinobacterium caligoides]
MKLIKSIAGGLLVATLTLGAQLSVAAETLKIALIPAEDSRAMIKASEALMNELEKKLGIEVEAFVATDYNGVIEALRAKHVDVAYLGPFSYVKAVDIANVEAFAVAETKKKGSVAYHSQIIAQKDSAINSLDDLKGHSFAFVSPTSTSGYVFPMVGLKEHGIEPTRDFANVVYTGAHDANILALKNHRVDAVTVADRILDAALEKGLISKDDYKVIWRSDAIPESPMAWRKDLPAPLKAKIKAAFLSMENVKFGDQGAINRYIETNDKAYDVVRNAGKIARK